MPLLLKHRVAFIHIPKTGGTTIEQILIDAFPDDFCFMSRNRSGLLKFDPSSRATQEMNLRIRAVTATRTPTRMQPSQNDDFDTRRITFAPIVRFSEPDLYRMPLAALSQNFMPPPLQSLSLFQPNALARLELPVKQALRWPPLQHWIYNDIKLVIPDLDDWWSFAFVRSPWSRIFSEYRYQSGILKANSLSFHEWLPRALDAADKDISIYLNHLRPQWQFLGGQTKVYRFENLKTYINEICKMLKISPNHIPVHFKSGDPDEYRLAFNDKVIERVGEFYHEDVKRFGYQFE